jgi:hypothetical protein
MASNKSPTLQFIQDLIKNRSPYDLEAEVYILRFLVDSDSDLILSNDLKLKVVAAYMFYKRDNGI